MSSASYSTKFLVSASPQAVYKAVTSDIDSWWTEIANDVCNVGDRLIVRFEKTTSWVMTLSEAIPHRSVIWEVVEANHDLEVLARRDEWEGTTIVWTIREDEGGSRITFVHKGLSPALDCFEICASGWTYFLGSLKSYLETGRGRPFRKASDDASSE